MTAAELDIFLADEGATRRFGEDLALLLTIGDVIFLSGDLGAGKSALARAAIRCLMEDDRLEVPSPSFSIVQSYAGRLPILHADLYRISDVAEIEETGLWDGIADRLTFLEWPERAGESIRPTLSIMLAHEGSGRRARVSGDPDAQARLQRSLAIRGLLDKGGWGEARRSFLLGDASSRSYETVSLGSEPDRIVMNAPRRPDGPPVRDGLPYSRIAHLAESVHAFVAVGGALSARGFRAPAIHLMDLERGLLVIEHLGAGTILKPDRTPDHEAYRHSARLLAEIAGEHWPKTLPVAADLAYDLPTYDRRAMLIEAELLIDWYVPDQRGHALDPSERAAWLDAWNEVLDSISDAEMTLVLRDYHSPNIIWRPKAQGRDRIGLIDFQDAVIGPAAYDLASLALDARVTIDEALEKHIVEAYLEARAHEAAFDRDRLLRDYAVMAAQRNAKILGIFVRLDRRDGKPHYRVHLPRIRDYLERSTRHPVLAPVRALLREHGILDTSR